MCYKTHFLRITVLNYKYWNPIHFCLCPFKEVEGLMGRWDWGSWGRSDQRWVFLLDVTTGLSSPGGWAWCCSVLCYNSPQCQQRMRERMKLRGLQLPAEFLPWDKSSSVLHHDWGSPSLLRTFLLLPFSSLHLSSRLPLGLFVCAWALLCSADFTRI